MAVACQVEAIGQGVSGLLVAGISCGQLRLDVLELTGNAVLFGLEQVERDRSCVVGFQELLALGGQNDALLVEVTAFGGCCGLEAVEVFEDELLDAVAQILAERDRPVLVLDELLNQVDGHGLALTVRGPPLAP